MFFKKQLLTAISLKKNCFVVEQTNFKIRNEQHTLDPTIRIQDRNLRLVYDLSLATVTRSGSPVRGRRCGFPSQNAIKTDKRAVGRCRDLKLNSGRWHRERFDNVTV